MAPPTIAPEEKRPKQEDPGDSSDSVNLEPFQAAKNLSGWKLALVMTGLCLAVFCMALDNTIIATAIPRITDEFRALDDLGWYGSAYLLTTCSFQLFFGKLYSYYSVKWVFLAAIGFFELGSLVCGAAPTSTALIIGRAIAGIGSAGIFSGAILIIVLSVPMRQRPTYVGILAGMYGVSSVAGPLMGGAFTDKLTWRWCFYINLPLGVVTVLFVALLFNPPQSGSDSPKNKVSWRKQVSHFDLEGSVCFLPAIISLLLALQWGGSRYPWSDGRVIGLFVVFGVLISLFVVIQRWKQDKATVPPRILSDRTVWSCAAFAVCFGASFFLLIYYIPIWFQAVKGASAVRSGVMNLPMILGLVVMSVLAGGVVSALGYYTPLILASSVLMSIGAGLLTTFHLSTDSPAWIGYQALYGIGAGLGMQLPLVAVQTALAEHDIPVGTATLMFSQTLGGSVFVQVAQNVFTNQLATELRGVGVDAEIVLSVGATELRDNVPAQLLHQVLVAYSKALTNTWYVSVATAVLSLIPAAFIPWKSVTGKKVEAPTA
ncbi:major facilitator superfamily domain-containing protein [Thelonectria olida]|uniref:Major facilitator superfamily domain-containing protein n=1 Tax=Thelonectria olida TaxID=1576542 RepID=A0A9P8VY61_9HYPO|nr:major facilitator superfamily domain-containing protein [Thelonectria olida]